MDGRWFVTAPYILTNLHAQTYIDDAKCCFGAKSCDHISVNQLEGRYILEARPLLVGLEGFRWIQMNMFTCAYV